MIENGNYNGIHYSRFIASWTRSCRNLGIPVYFSGRFNEWLRSLGLPEDTVREIVIMADNGKLELETSATKFLEEHKKLKTIEEYYGFYRAGLITKEELKAALN